MNTALTTTGPTLERAGVSELQSYLPRVALEWERSGPGQTWREVDASLCFVDISGFTALSERLARRGRVGAEELTEVLNHVFSRMLKIAYAQGGSLLKFGGDALLLLFADEGHSLRTVHAAVAMRAALREAQTLPTSVGRLRLRMSVGVHSGTVNLFRVGTSHRELLISGPAASETVEMEHTAEAGEILVSPATASALPKGYVGAAKGPGFLLRTRRIVLEGPGPYEVSPLPPASIALGVPVALRDHLASGSRESEHRIATIGFIKYTGLDDLLTTQGPAATAQALHETVSVVQEAADAEEVTFLATDIDNDGGKIILATGVPRTGHDEEGRVLRTLRRVVEQPLPLAIRVGVNRGHVFAGDIGTDFRRTFTVMGDTVNLAARLMAAAQPGTILTTADVLDRSHTLFSTEAVPPFYVKGKAAPVHAYAVGAATGTRHETRSTLPFVGRSEELAALEAALTAGMAGRGRVVEIEADRGVGKSRLVDEFCSRHPGIRSLLFQGEPYGGGTPYLPFRRSLQEATGTADVSPDIAGKQLADLVASMDSEMAPLAPLLAPIFGVQLEETPESSAIAADFRLDRAADLLIRVLEFVAVGPLLIEAEDTHWFDETSGHILSRLATATRDHPWMMTVTRRPGEERGGVAADVSIKLRPIEVQEAAALLDSATEAAPLRPHESQAIIERAAGNPLFLEELVRVARTTGTDELPESLDSVANTHIDELPSQARLLLRHASVLGNRFEVDLLRALMEGESVDFDADVRRQLREYLAPDGAGQLRFRHALLREAAYAGLPFRLRRELHAKAAAGIARRARSAPERRADALSLHFFHAQDWPNTWLYARVAADRAKQEFAPSETIVHLERAIEATKHLPGLPPAEVSVAWDDLGEANRRLGYYSQAERAYRHAASLAHDAISWAEYMDSRAFVVGEYQRRYRYAIRLLHEALSRLEPVNEDQAEHARVRLLAREAQFRSRQAHYADALAVSQQVIERAKRIGEVESLAIAYGVTDEVLWLLGRSQEANHLPMALQLYEELGDLRCVATALANLGGTAYFSGRWDEAREYLRRASEMALRVGDIAGVAVCEMNSGELLANQGHLEEAYAALRQAVRIAKGLGYVVIEMQSLTQFGRVASRQGLHDEAVAALERAIELGSGEGLDAGVDAKCYLAQAWVFAGQPGKALDIIATVREQSHQAIAGTLTEVLLMRVEAMAVAAAGADAKRVEECIDEALASARQAGAPYDTAVLIDLRCRVGSPGTTSPALADERDGLVRQLGIVGLPAVP